MAVQRQVVLPVTYKGHALEGGFRIDLVVEDLVVVEVKAVETLLSVHEAQLLTYLQTINQETGASHELQLDHGRKCHQTRREQPVIGCSFVSRQSDAIRRCPTRNDRIQAMNSIFPLRLCDFASKVYALDVALQTGKLAENVMHFARVLREAGLPVGPDRVIDALRALQVAGIERRDDFYWTLAAVFLTGASSSICTTRPSTSSGAIRSCSSARWRCCCQKSRAGPRNPTRNRAATAWRRLFAPKQPPPSTQREEQPPEIEIDATLTASAASCCARRTSRR